MPDCGCRQHQRSQQRREQRCTSFSRASNIISFERNYQHVVVEAERKQQLGRRAEQRHGIERDISINFGTGNYCRINCGLEVHVAGCDDVRYQRGE